MSDVTASTYDYPAVVTVSDSVNDPAGPFTGLYVSASGVLKFTPLSGPQAYGAITINVFEGTYLCFPVKRVWSGTTTATVIGLVSPIVKQGPTP